MDNQFFERPILNSPYEYPSRHWELDEQGQPTQRIIESRRTAEFITPIPPPRKRKAPAEQRSLTLDEGKGLSDEKQQYEGTSAVINELRHYVDQWRNFPNPNDWKVTPDTQRLLQHWRHHKFNDVRPFFCQIEAVETAIWLTEVAPQMGKTGKKFLDHLANASAAANPELLRLALKLATGAGKTTVMAMIIAWQTINAVRQRGSSRFTRGFLIVTPGLTIRDRLQVLQPNDPYSYYKERELVPGDMLGELESAKIVITNYHAFKLREVLERLRDRIPDPVVQRRLPVDERTPSGAEPVHTSGLLLGLRPLLPVQLALAAPEAGRARDIYMTQAHTRMSGPAAACRSLHVG
jgi:type III restriction enzyme